MSTENESSQESPPAHTSEEMARIIMMVTSATQKDEEEYQTWLTRRNNEQAKWEKLTPEEKTQRMLMGQGWQEKIRPPMRKNIRLLRRQLRYKLFRIREGKWATDKELAALKAWYELQLQKGWTWADFTFKWDVSSKDPLQVITPFEWDGEVTTEHGGRYCDPAAFTEQEI